MFQVKKETRLSRCVLRLRAVAGAHCNISHVVCASRRLASGLPECWANVIFFKIGSVQDLDDEKSVSGVIFERSSSGSCTVAVCVHDGGRVGRHQSVVR